MKYLVLLTILLAPHAVNAATVTYDFSGSYPLDSFIHIGSSFEVVNEQLIPPLITDFYNTSLTLKNSVIGGAGNNVTLTADFLYETSLINPNPAEVPGLSLFITGDGSDARGEMRAFGTSNTDVVAYCVTDDVNSRNEGNPVVTLEDDTWYRLVFELQLIGGTFNDELLLTVELFKLGTGDDQLISSFSVNSYNFHMLQTATLTVGLNAQGSAGIAAIDNFTVCCPIEVLQLTANAGPDIVACDGTVTLDGSRSTYDAACPIESYQSSHINGNLVIEKTQRTIERLRELVRKSQIFNQASMM